jgi:hypothetical protein
MAGGLVNVQYSSGGSTHFCFEYTFKGKEDEVRGWTA